MSNLDTRLLIKTVSEDFLLISRWLYLHIFSAYSLPVID